MERTQAPNEIDGVNSDPHAPSKCFGDSIERYAIVRIVECRYKNGAIGDVEVGVAGRQPLAVHGYRTRERNRDDFEGAGLCGNLQAAKIICRSRVILVRGIGLVRQDHRLSRRESRDVVDVAMSVVPNRALAQPYRICDAEILRECPLVIGGGHAWVPYLDVRQQPLLCHKYQTSATNFDPTALENQGFAIVESNGFHPRQPGDTLDDATDLRILTVIIVFRPAVESPIDELDSSVRAEHAGWRRVAEPDTVVGRDVQAVLVGAILHAVGAEQRTRVLRNRLVVTKNLHAIEIAQCANDLRVHPRDRGELARPVRLVVRPGDPGCIVLLPLGGHSPRERQIHNQSAASLWSGAFSAAGPRGGGSADTLRHPMYRLRIGAYASMRRSRRNGRLRRVLSMSTLSHFATNTAGSVPASARIRPNGSEMKECPKNSIPSVPGSSSCPTRLGDATYTPLAIA